MMLRLLLNEALWFPAATLIALLAATALLVSTRTQSVAKRTRATLALNLFYGVLIGIMGVGHLLAVSIKTVAGTLPASTNAWLVFPLGFALAVPAWWLVVTVRALKRSEKAARATALGLNLWLGLILLIPAGPLAAPAALNLVMLAMKAR